MAPFDHVIPLAAALCLCTGSLAQDSEAPAGEPTAEADPSDPIELLLEEVDELYRTIDALREELAQARLDAAESRRELDALRQFILDHDAYGRDFARYEAVKAAAEEDARRRRAEAGREDARARRAAREKRYREARAQRELRQAELDRIEGYREAGFSPLGFDVFVGRMAFYYPTDNALYGRVRFNPLGRRYLSVYPGTTIDYSTMTISGSILNTSDIVRDIGIAVAFFDEDGGQVGAEIVQVNNARPDVPYPFTATIDMALNRPFMSSSSYVLYADPSPGATVPGP